MKFHSAHILDIPRERDAAAGRDFICGCGEGQDADLVRGPSEHLDFAEADVELDVARGMRAFFVFEPHADVACEDRPLQVRVKRVRHARDALGKDRFMRIVVEMHRAVGQFAADAAGRDGTHAVERVGRAEIRLPIAVHRGRRGLGFGGEVVVVRVEGGRYVGRQAHHVAGLERGEVVRHGSRRSPDGEYIRGAGEEAHLRQRDIVIRAGVLLVVFQSHAKPAARGVSRRIQRDCAAQPGIGHGRRPDAVRRAIVETRDQSAQPFGAATGTIHNIDAGHWHRAAHVGHPVTVGQRVGVGEIREVAVDGKAGRKAAVLARLPDTHAVGRDGGPGWFRSER